MAFGKSREQRESAPSQKSGVDEHLAKGPKKDRQHMGEDRHFFEKKRAKLRDWRKRTRAQAPNSVKTAEEHPAP